MLACAGDIITMETLAAAWLLRRYVPRMAMWVVNIVDLMSLFPADLHLHGLSEASFQALFTDRRPMIIAFHGYARALHQILHGRPSPDRFHVRGFMEQGTTTPFDMVVLNEVSRYHLALEALRRARRTPQGAAALAAHC